MSCLNHMTDHSVVEHVCTAQNYFGTQPATGQPVMLVVVRQVWKLRCECCGRIELSPPTSNPFQFELPAPPPPTLGALLRHWIHAVRRGTARGPTPESV